METKGESKSGRVGVSIDRNVAEILLEIKEELQESLGVTLSFTQVIEYLAKQHIKTK
jgi:hypothetical protein